MVESNYLLSRKFLLSILALVMTGLLCAFKLIESSVYSTIIITVVGGYFASNVSQKVLTGGTNEDINKRS